MPRPKRLSDEAALTVAMEMLAECGMDFTLNDLAARVGLSRATLIQRFGDRDAILERIARHEVEATRTWLAAIPVEHEPGALRRFLDHIVGSMGGGEGFSVRVAFAAFEARQPALARLAGERYSLVQAAIAERLPRGPRREATARHLHAVIAGATMQWVASSRATGLDAFVLAAVEWALDALDLDSVGRRL